MKTISLFSFLFFMTLGRGNADANGGTKCAGCAILVGLAEQLAQIHDSDIVTAVENNLCKILPNPFDEVCRALLVEFGSVVIDGLYHQETPDIICHTIGFCTQDPGKEFCHVFPLPRNFSSSTFYRRKMALWKSKLSNFYGKIDDFSICSLPGVKEICKKIDQFSSIHLPILDWDEDRFSDNPTLRGTHWRGKDCDDKRNDVYPGRKPINYDIHNDSNCNGIYGVDPQSGIPYEELFCSKSNRRGVMILGDSAGAHFHIPPDYIIVENYNVDTFNDILMFLTDEFDWPQLSSTTAYTQNQWPHSIYGPVDSIYMRLLKENHCHHRDYQNIAVNGGSSGNMHEIMQGLARNSSTDYPLIILLALVGNDVCNGHPDTIKHMTTPEVYRANMVAVLNHLNATIPKGSAVLISGLADGRVLWNTMSERIHPLGQLNSDVRYKDLYHYLNCLEVSPCVGWMNKNETLRNLTSQRAADLSAQAKNITETMKYEQFDMEFIDFDIGDMMRIWEARGGQDWEVIEPVDGFHPGQIGQALSAEYIYQVLSSKYPDIIGKLNPYNEKISKIFGDQGGY